MSLVRRWALATFVAAACFLSGVAHGASAAPSPPAVLARSLALHPSDVGKGYKVERPALVTRATIEHDAILGAFSEPTLSEALKNGFQGSYFGVLSGPNRAFQVYVGVLSNAGDARWFYAQALTNIAGTRVSSPAVGTEHRAFQSHNFRGSSQETTVIFRRGRFVAYVDLIGGTATAGPPPATVVRYAAIVDHRMKNTP